MGKSPKTRQDLPQNIISFGGSATQQANHRLAARECLTHHSVLFGQCAAKSNILLHQTGNNIFTRLFFSHYHAKQAW
ncbi:hypothetical protein [Thalassospira marina]|uniref:Uncharacterized protein n=1 Tax=Thalassospira marina TaxID=2048283 RepID=A0A2N3KBB4_9PROT|nr:hypothetical protein [Thalassospira marina]AUG53512.1 hypothetical protein CSC3H3_12920 [Thalassospira marina]PKR47753.1 hypothetical protein COO20_25475 [Thalassospira marina]